MGRYYDGDISGKFWFGVQASDDADFFGVEGYQPSYLEYNFGADNIDGVEQGIKECYAQLAQNKERLDKFFDELKNGYNDDMIKKHWKETYAEDLDDYRVQGLLQWYARLELGERIYECLKANGSCSFRAEV